MAFKNYREASRDKNWGTNDDNLNRDQINTGSFLRIADAMEFMAKDRLQMERDLDWYKKKYAEHNETIKRLERSNAALKGHIKRLKNKPKNYYA